MSSQAMNDRRDRSSRSVPHNGRQQWIPRGARAGAGLLNTPPHNHNHNHNVQHQSGVGGGSDGCDVEVVPLQMGRGCRGRRGGEGGGGGGGDVEVRPLQMGRGSRGHRGIEGGGGDVEMRPLQMDRGSRGHRGIEGGGGDVEVRPLQMDRGSRGHRGGEGGDGGGDVEVRPLQMDRGSRGHRGGEGGGDVEVRPLQMDRGSRGHRGGEGGGDVEVRPLQMDRGGRGHRGAEGGGGGGNNRSHIGRPQNYRRERIEGRDGIGWRGNRDKDRSYQRRSGDVVDSDLPQLVQEIQEKLTKGTVECMICYDMVKRTAPVWSCSSCYSIFHLNCIKKWARAPSSIDTSAEKSQGFNWRCPGCQSVQLTTSKEIRYLCFCGKRHDPPSDLYLTPHSCGEPCGKPLEKEVGSGLSKEDLCPHVCVLQCHPGPCPPCKAFAPPRPCPCGKKVITTRCYDRKIVHSCGQVCGKLLDCGRHLCDQICHVGSCGPCKVLIDASCFCKKKSEALLCGDMMVKGEMKADDGLFSCSSKCGRKLMCGNHYCAETCHPGPCGECELLPSRVKTCYCGKTAALQDQRRSCMDPIPTCSGTCSKLLPCGIHHCKEKCHSGPCPPCHEVVSHKCRCGATSRTVECHRTTTENEMFVCDRPCGRKKKCGRHRCSERCCPLSSADNSASGDWNPHFCTVTCGKKLRCGQHSCDSFCHSGHCPPCLETIFTDLTCACGRTSIPPPLPCGTPPPSCQYPCSVPQPCGHQSTHSCHFGECPPCSIPIAKECIGGHVVLRNIPCGSKDIRCNKLCGKTRRCGLHACARTCHPPPCDPSCGSSHSSPNTSCGQTCGAPRRDCRHTCTALCHPGSLCPDVRCEFPVTIACSCARITATVPCDAGGSSSTFTSENVLEALIIQKLPVPLQPVEANERRIPLGQRKLLCDDECAKLERKRVLADAFDITPSLDALHFGENPAVSQVLSELLRRDPKWVLAVEERCKYLVLGKSRGSGSNIKVHVFCPMLKEKRDAVRLIAERWKLTISAAGWEPKRFIVVHATAKSKAPPRVLGPKGVASVSAYHPPVFDPLVDMDPRMVVALFDLPSDADISTLVLRFGGECELVWLNDKNALAVFGDPARAATAMRRLDNGSVYQGAAVVQQTSGTGSSATASGANPWGGGGGGATSGLKGNPWKKAVVKESNWVEDSWGDEEWSSGSVDVGPSAWNGRESSITATVNRWTVLNSDSSSSSSPRAMDLGKQKVAQPNSGKESETDASNMPLSQAPGSPVESPEVVDDWEKAYE